MDIADKVALVTGGAGGIGSAIVEQLLDKGAKSVTIIDVTKEKGEKLAEELVKKYGADKAVFIKCDVSDAEQLEVAFVATKSRFGQLDIVCNNAGIGNEFKLQECVAINLTAVIRGTYLAVEHMGTKNGGNGGVVINTSSMAGLGPFPLIPIYVGTKHGIVGFTRSVAKEPMVIENSIRVSVICPCLVNTNLLNNLDDKYRYPDAVHNLFETLKPAMTPTELAANVITMIEDTKYDGSACAVSAKLPLTIIDPPSIDLK